MLELDYILSIKVERIKKEIRIFQMAYTKKMLEKFNIANYKSRSIPLSVRTFLSINNLFTNEEKVAALTVRY